MSHYCPGSGEQGRTDHQQRSRGENKKYSSSGQRRISIDHKYLTFFLLEFSSELSFELSFWAFF